MFELYQLRYFLAVVETGSFTKAAARVHVSQPTLSAGIARLETIVGAPLFDRSRRRVFLTAAGTRFLPRAKTIFAECHQAMDDVRETGPIRTLRLGALLTVSARITGDVLRRLRAALPDAALELTDGTEQAVRSAFDAGQIDMALTLLRTDSPEQAALPLFDEGYVAVLAPEHPLASRDMLHAEDLAGEPIIVRSRCEVLSETSRYFTTASVRPPLAYRTDQDARAVAMVAAGLGYTTVPESHVTADVRALPLSGFGHRRTVGLMFGHGLAGSDRAAIVAGMDGLVAKL